MDIYPHIHSMFIWVCIYTYTIFSHPYIHAHSPSKYNYRYSYVYAHTLYMYPYRSLWGGTRHRCVAARADLWTPGFLPTCQSHSFWDNHGRNMHARSCCRSSRLTQKRWWLLLGDRVTVPGTIYLLGQFWVFWGFGSGSWDLNRDIKWKRIKKILLPFEHGAWKITKITLWSTERQISYKNHYQPAVIKLQPGQSDALGTREI